jgi:hypothetical protein
LGTFFENWLPVVRSLSAHKRRVTSIIAGGSAVYEKHRYRNRTSGGVSGRFVPLQLKRDPQLAFPAGQDNFDVVMIRS